MHVSKSLRRLAVVAATSSLLGAVPFAAPAAATTREITSVSPNAYANSGSVTVTLKTTHTFATSGLSVTVSRNGVSTDTVTVAGGADAPKASGGAPGTGTTITAKLLMDNTNPGMYDIKVGGSGQPMEAPDPSVEPPDAGTEPTPYEDVCTQCFEVFAYAPDVTALSPSTIGGNAYRVVDITGTGFTTDTSHNYCTGTAAACAGKPTLTITPSDGISVHQKTVPGGSTDVAATTATRIQRTIQVAAGATPGPRDVTVTNTDGKTDTCVGCFVVGPTPTLTAATPPALARGVSGKSVVLTGTNFHPNATVWISPTEPAEFPDSTAPNGVSYTSKTWNSATQITLNGVAVDPDETDAPTGPRWVIVTNPDGGVVLTTSIFRVNAPPKVDSVVEDESATDDYGQGALNRTVSIGGSNFQDGAEVTLSNPAGITVNSKTVSPGSIVLNVTLAQAGDGAPALGGRTVTVTNPDFGTVTSDTADVLTVANGPKVTGISPMSRGKGESFTGMVVSGTTFDVKNGVEISIEDVAIDPATVRVNTAGTTITFNGVVESGLNVSGTKDIVVVNKGNKGRYVCADCFTVDNLQTNAVTPGNVLNDGAKQLTISGSGFASDATVELVKAGTGANSVPNIAGSNVTVNQEGTSLVATFAMAGVAPGEYTIRVTNPTINPGVGTCLCRLNVFAAKPDVTSVSPASRGAGAQNEVLTIAGTGFMPGASVTFDNAKITLAGTPTITPTQITVPVNIAGDAAPAVPPAPAHQVKVTNTDGQSDSVDFTVNKPPAPSAVSPSERAQGTTTTVTVTGRDFVDSATLLLSGTGVTVGTVTRGTSASNPLDQTLTATFTVAEDAATGARTITVRNGDGGRASCASCTFTVTAKPMIDTVSPDKGARDTSPVVTIAGTGFVPGSSVSVSGGGISPTVTAAAGNSLTVTFAVAKDAELSTRDVTVTNPDGGVATKLAAFKVFTTPGAPTNVTGTRGNGQATVSWVAPIDNGNDPLTEYVVTASPGGATTSVGGSTLTATIEGLTNGTAYTFTVVAKNAAGAGEASAASLPVTPATTPGAPTGVTATAGEGNAVVSWLAPASNGGDDVTGYTVTASPGNVTKTVAGDVLSTTVPGLTNGTAYTFTVAATNTVGTGPASAASAAVTPYTVPGAPTDVAATPADGAANVRWKAPELNGGREITGYTITATPGGATKQVDGALSSVMFDGLTNGTAYTFTVFATNERGAGPASAASAAVTPYTKAGAPTAVQVTPGDGEVTVTWAAPQSDGGNAISEYVVTVSPGGTEKKVAGDTLSTVFKGLTNGIEYTFTVGATNAAGTTTSAPSAPVTPRTVPDAPAIVSVTRGDQSATVTWTAPVSNGGSPVTGYTVTSAPGGVTKTVAGDATSAVVDGLTNGTAYTFTVVAKNAAGDSAPSAASQAVTPAGAPFAPGSAVATAGTNGTATVSWSEAAANGSPVTGYTVTSTPGGLTRSVSAGSRSVAFSGLNDGTAYTFAVTATNAAGTGAARTTNAVTPKATTGLSLSVTPQIVAGGTTTLRGVLTKSNGTRLVGQPIRVYAKPAGASAFTLVRTVTTNADGAYATSFTLTKTHTFVTIFPGSGSLTPFRSAERVTKVAYKVTASYALSGRTLTAYGSVLPNAAGRLVYLRYRKSDGTLVTLTYTKVASNGTYRMAKGMAPGTYNVFVYMPAGSTNVAGQSPFRSIGIR